MKKSLFFSTRSQYKTNLKLLAIKQFGLKKANFFGTPKSSNRNGETFYKISWKKWFLQTYIVVNKD